jgi:predicted TPR repeat methyltransferase
MSSSSTTANARFLPDRDYIAEADALIASGQARVAAALLQPLIDAGRGGLLLRLVFQRALIEAGDVAAALATARETALTNVDAAPAALALGQALAAAGQLPVAIGEFQRTLRLDPDLDDARIALGSAWLDAGEAEKALEAWHAVENEGATAAVASRIADAERLRTQARCDPRYVRHLFDQFSTDYDSRMLGPLGYSAPAILQQLAELLGLAGAEPRAILDLGCGTGLMGEAVRDWAGRLDGVDLSPAMIAKARARGIYKDLWLSDLCEWLAQPGRSYELIFAADTLVYLGDLAPVFDGAASRLVVGGHFLFTVERKDGAGFELGPKRRWRHSEAYLRAEAERAHLEFAGLMSCVPRMETGVPVEGFVVAVTRLQ